MKTAILKWITQYGARWGRFIPSNLLAPLQRNTPLIILRDKNATIYFWLENRFDEGVDFPQTDEGRQALSRLLDTKTTSGTAYLLTDMIEEELRAESIPRLRGGHRTGLVERRLERMFRNTPYRRADFQGRQAGNTDRVLFSALTAPNLIQPWVALLREHGIVVAGLWSIPLLSRDLMRHITTTSANALLVSLNDTGQRHTYFHQGRTLVSRLIPSQHTSIQHMAAAIHDETNRTRLYLNVLRLLRRETALDVYILCHHELSSALRDHPSPANGCRMQPRLTDMLADRMKLISAPNAFTSNPALGKHGERGMDLLVAHRLMLHAPPNHYVPPEMLKGHVATWLAATPLAGLTSFISSTLAAQPEEETATSTGEGEDKPSSTQPVRRIGELLLEKGAISRHQLEIAVSEQKRIGQPFGKTLITLGFISEDAMRDLLGEALEQETADLNIKSGDPEAIRRIPKAFARRHTVLPLAWDAESQKLTVAMANTLNMVVIDKLHTLLPKGVTVRPLLAGENELATAIDRLYGFDLSVDGILREIETGEVDMESVALDAETFDHPMVRLVNALITDAVKREASDMHINPMASFTQVRYRIDGVLQEARILHRKFFSGLSVRIKIMSGMNIAEIRIPQDGHFSSVIANASIDFRVSTQPTAHGENIVLRILDRTKGLLGLHNLGLASENTTMLKHVMGRPEGIILVTGPTGSGKTTTLYSMLSTLNAKKSNIMTLEDPVEYLLDAILQTSVNKAVDLDFSSGVRSMLRQDPDIILVGEIRDLDTAQMALRAAMTGHQVYSTLHANSALAAIFRLLNIGLRPDMLAGNIIGMLGQRLIRKLCLQCKQPAPPSKAGEPRLFDIGPEEKATLHVAVGCNTCNDTGYKGRICIMEGIVIDDDFNDLISSNAPQGDYRRLAQKKGLLTMADFARRRVLDGTTSMEEFSRVFGTTTIMEEPTHHA